MHLCLEAMLRAGAGYVVFCGEECLWNSALLKFPELLYERAEPTEQLTEADISRIAERSASASATLIGCGSGRSDNLERLVLRLLSSEGGALIIDADAINSLANDKERATEALKKTSRKVILTPHPLEFSRLTGLSADEISSDREGVALHFAREVGAILLLKGNETVITDGSTVYVNTSGSSALAKAGSGDCLAGLLSSLVATRLSSPLTLAALAAYIHGAAADDLADTLSEYGVTPSDLPKAMASVIRRLERLRS